MSAGTISTRTWVYPLARYSPAFDGLLISVPQVVAGGVILHVPPWDGSADERGTNVPVVSSEKGLPDCTEVTALIVQPPRMARAARLVRPLPGNSYAALPLKTNGTEYAAGP